MDEYALDLDLSYPIWEVLHESMGFGKPNGHVPSASPSARSTTTGNPSCATSPTRSASTSNRVALDWETILAPHDLDTALGVIPKDTICGHRWQLAAMHDERPVVSVQYFAAVTSTPWPDTWPRPAQPGQGGMVFRIEGNPNMTLDLHLDPTPDDATNPGVAATAMAAINAIPAVIDAPARTPRRATGRSRRSSPVRRVADMTDPKTVDLYYDPFDFDIDDDPYPVWRRMREEAPLYYNERHDFYALSRWDDVCP